MGGGLREVAEELAGTHVGFLRHQPEVVGEAECSPEVLLGALHLTGQRQAFDEPEGAESASVGSMISPVRPPPNDGS